MFVVMLEDGMSKKTSERSQFSAEEILNEAGEESFPASDPITWTLGSSHTHYDIQGNDNNHTALGQLLAFEHHVILTVMTIVKYLSHHIADDKKIDPELIDQLISFSSEFIEKFHQCDDRILDHLTKGEAQLSQYLIHDLRHEHVYGKQMFHNLKMTFNNYLKEKREAKLELINLLKDIYDLYTNHIAKEDEYMLPAIAALIDLKTQEKLASHFVEMKKVVCLNQYRKLMNVAHKLSKTK